MLTTTTHKVIATLAAGAWCAISASAAVLRVPTVYPTIQQAISAASYDDQIFVYPGIYEGPFNTNGKSIHIRSVEGPSNTFLTVPNVFPKPSVVVINTNEGPDTIIEGFTITGGGGGLVNVHTHDAPDGVFVLAGGGVLIDNAAPTIRNCVFFNNAAAWGGGLFARGQAYIDNCTFTGNHATERGGGAVLINGAVMRDTRVEYNSASVGGGLLLRGSVVQECEIVNNEAADLGGGVALDPSAIGAQFAYLINSSIVDNFSAGRGGGVGAHTGPTVNAPVALAAERCLIARNSAPIGGGVAVWAEGGSAPHRIENSLILANEAINGGGVSFHGDQISGVFDILNCTISGNTGGALSAGVAHVSVGLLRVSNTILWGNVYTPPAIGGPSTSETNTERSQISSSTGEGVSVSHSLLPAFTHFAGAGNIAADPMFVEPFGSDGNYATDGADLRLRSDSPCIDAGDTIAAIQLMAGDTDYFGADRLAPGAVASPAGVPRFGLYIDIGAHEFHPAAPSCPADLTGDGQVGSADLATMLGSWGVCPN